jgi:hypothetical protein
MRKPSILNKVLSGLAVSLMIFSLSVIFGRYLNPSSVTTFEANLTYIGLGALTVFPHSRTRCLSFISLEAHDEIPSEGV